VSKINEKQVPDINPGQKRAIEYFKGPMLVLAGPGSGKTFVIIQRTKYLIEHYGVDPSKILVITFTKAAALEMKERFSKLMNGKNSGVNFGTFHAIFFKILKYAYHYNYNNIIKEEERYGYFKEIIRELELKIEDEGDFIEGISGEISLVKSERMDIEYYYSMNCAEEIFQKIYKGYEDRLRKSNQIDFDDMLLLCYELLKARPDILKNWQEKYQYIMVDEAQDSNTLQYDIICLLASQHKNVVFVGDDDQSLYRFRGAKPEIMLNFKSDFPDGERIFLNLNYRSQRNIVEGALSVIKNNTKRYAKKITTVREPGEEIILKTFKNLSEENKKILEEVRKYNEKGVPLKDIAILFRTNSQPRVLVELFMEYNIPFKMKDGMPNIYEHWIAKDMFSYIKIALGSLDREFFLKIINRPKRYIARDCFIESRVDFLSMKEFYKDKSYVVDRIDKLEYDLKVIKNHEPNLGIHYIRKGIGYDEYLKEYADYRRIKVDELYMVLDELQESAKNFKTYEMWFEHIDDYKIELKDQAMKRNNNDIDSISMMTFHGSKGLEYEVVFIIDVNESITPHCKAISNMDMEEERRMFYVAMTRAKSNLHIYSVKERYNKELVNSRFVGELLVDAQELREGTRIMHATYGEGTIMKESENKLTIKFDKIFLPKKMDREFCIRNQVIRNI
jgi:DNA helicase II / ATP-dependent DNA helicase PcrA